MIVYNVIKSAEIQNKTLDLKNLHELDSILSKYNKPIRAYRVGRYIINGELKKQFNNTKVENLWRR